MSWKHESCEHYLDLIHHFRSSDQSSRSVIYEPRNTFTSIEVNLLEGCSRLEIVPYKVDALSHDVEIPTPRGTLNRLLVGIRDDRLIAYVSKLWTPRELDGEGFEQYFFSNDRPSLYSATRISSSTWPLNHGVAVGPQEMPYFRLLSQQKPMVSRSLEACLPYLRSPGINHQDSSESLVQLPTR